MHLCVSVFTKVDVGKVCMSDCVCTYVLIKCIVCMHEGVLQMSRGQFLCYSSCVCKLRVHVVYACVCEPSACVSVCVLVNVRCVCVWLSVYERGSWLCECRVRVSVHERTLSVPTQKRVQMRIKSKSEGV